MPPKSKRRQVPRDPNYRTDCPPAIKAKITELENAVFEYGLQAGRWTRLEDEISEAQTARYDLERTILTYLARAGAA